MGRVAARRFERRHLRRTPTCLLVVFEAVPPFRGVEANGEPELVEIDRLTRVLPLEGGLRIEIPTWTRLSTCYGVTPGR
jgi:hypothetical protein